MRSERREPPRVGFRLSVTVAGVLFSMALAGTAIAVETVQVKADIEASAQVRFQGVSNATFGLTGLIYDTTKPPNDVDLRLRVENATITLLNFPYTVTGDRQGERVKSHFPSETVWTDAATASLRLVVPPVNGSYRILALDPGRPLQLTLGACDVQMGPPQNWADESEGMGAWTENLSRPTVPRGPAGALVSNTPRPFEAAGAAYSVLFGGTFLYEPAGKPRQQIVTGERLNPDKTVTDPGGNFGTWWYDLFVLVAEGPSLTSTLSASDPRLIRAAFQSAEGTWDGDFAFAGVSGRTTVDGKALPTESQLLQVIGDFDGRADYSGENGRWGIEGPATFVGVNGEVVRGERPGSRPPPVAAVLGGLTLLALLAAFFTHLGREFLTFITGRNIARPLESRVRVGFLQEIAKSPGTTLSQLASKFDMSSWGARYHIGVLKRAHYVDEILNGNTYTYMLNSHSYRFYADALPTASPPTKEVSPSAPSRVFVAGAIAELNHPTRRLIFETLRRIGPAHYGQLVEVWQKEGVPEPHPTPRDLTYHGTKMEESGLLHRRRMGANVIWQVALDMDRVDTHQRRAYLRDPAAKAVYESVASRPHSTLPQILADVSRVIRKKTRTTVRETLLRLEQAGIVQSDQRDGSYSLTPSQESGSPN